MYVPLLSVTHLIVYKYFVVDAPMCWGTAPGTEGFNVKFQSYGVGEVPGSYMINQCLVS